MQVETGEAEKIYKATGGVTAPTFKRAAWVWIDLYHPGVGPVVTDTVPGVSTSLLRYQVASSDFATGTKSLSDFSIHGHDFVSWAGICIAWIG